MEKIVIYCDGACEPNPGHGGAGWCVQDETSEGWAYLGQVHHIEASHIEASEVAMTMTNNIAEYLAVVLALSFLEAAGRIGVPVVVRTDSMLVVEQLNGRWACNKPHLQRLRQEIVRKVAAFPRGVSFEHVRREDNERADTLSKKALAEHGIVARTR